MGRKIYPVRQNSPSISPGDSVSTLEIKAGRELAGRYRLTSLLGQGGMGSVWRADHLTLGSEVAIKLIDPTIAGSEQARERFVREAQSAAKLRSPHVVQILDYGVDGEIPFIVMELLNGESLADRLDRVGRLSLEETARIMSEVTRALTRAHEAGIIHRDLKPDNIFLNENDDTEVAKVLDFGVAKIEEFTTAGAAMTSTGAVLGTPYYMSPEQAEGSKSMDHRTDIWAMSVMTYECIVGVRPFDGETLASLFISICSRDIPVPSSVAEVPAGFDEWFKKGTSRLLADRFKTAREAAEALRAICHVPEPERASALPSEANFDTTLLAHESPVTGANLSMPGLAHTTFEVPGTKAPNYPIWVAGALAVLVVVGLLVWNSRDGATEALPEATAQEDDASDPDEKLAGRPESPAINEEPEPPPASLPKPEQSPPPKPSAEPPPAVAKKPVTVAKPIVRPPPAPAPAPARSPAPQKEPVEPAPQRINLGI